ncbi:hypothetical protein E6O75_ATG08459 [Venturia nashicola]|uniref:RING-type domain-containing protein n=1 Tax=Venturia nashicola TaxID=86259 RepID=A0A4Z1P1C6_9PEZI|nr:hypothetical protein E6O75_ATG08459 [Venturia nashicola]
MSNANWIPNPTGPGWVKRRDPTATPNIEAGSLPNKNIRQWTLLPRRRFLLEQIRELPLSELSRLPKDETCIFCYDELRNHVGGIIVELPCGHMFGKQELMMFLNGVDETRCFNNRCPKCLRVLCRKASPPGGAPLPPPPPALVVRQMPQNRVNRLQRSIRRRALANPRPVKLLDEAILILSITWLLVTTYKTLNKIAHPPPLNPSTFKIPIWDLLILAYTYHRLACTAQNKYTEAIDFLRPVLTIATCTHFLLSTYKIYAASVTVLYPDAIAANLFLAVQTLPQITTLPHTTTLTHVGRLIALANTNRLNIHDFQNETLDWLFTEAMLEAGVCVLLVVILWMGWFKYTVAFSCVGSLVEDIFVGVEWRQGGKFWYEVGIPMVFIGISCVEIGFRVVLKLKGVAGR